ncbi:MAG: hypothetical protein ACM3RP_02840 [Chitinophagales bacterium]
MTLCKQVAVTATVILVLLGVLTAGTAAQATQKVLAGEVVAVDAAAGSLRLATPAGERVICLAPGATVWREGQPASLVALRPVANGFFHEALVWLDDQGRATRVDGFYPGFEAKVIAVTESTITLAPAGQDGDGSPGSARLSGPTSLRLTPGCRVGRDGEWLSPAILQQGDQVYVVLNLDGDVKKIAAPR